MQRQDSWSIQRRRRSWVSLLVQFVDLPLDCLPLLPSRPYRRLEWRCMKGYRAMITDPRFVGRKVAELVWWKFLSDKSISYRSFPLKFQFNLYQSPAIGRAGYPIKHSVKFGLLITENRWHKWRKSPFRQREFHARSSRREFYQRLPYCVPLGGSIWNQQERTRYIRQRHLMEC